MTGRVALAIGCLLVIGLGVAGWLALGDEGDETSQETTDSLPVPDCEPQPQRIAARAERAFRAQYGGDEWLSGVGPTTASAAREELAGLAEVGAEVSLVPETVVGEDMVLVVMFDPRADLPRLPGCVRGTPVLYAGTGTAQRD